MFKQQMVLITLLLLCNVARANKVLAENSIDCNSNVNVVKSEDAKRQAIGGLVAGEVGALEGFATGAATGELLGPVGAVVGGLLGLLGGLFGSSHHSHTPSHNTIPDPPQVKPGHVAVNPAIKPVAPATSVSENLVRNISVALSLPRFSILTAYSNPGNIPDKFCLGIKMDIFGPGLYGGQCMTKCPTDSPPYVERADKQIGCTNPPVCCVVNKKLLSSGCLGLDSLGLPKPGFCSPPGSCNDTTSYGCDGVNSECCIVQ